MPYPPNFAPFPATCAHVSRLDAWDGQRCRECQPVQGHADTDALAILDHLNDHEWCSGNDCNVEYDPTACPMYRDERQPVQAHADTDGLPPGEVEPVQAQPVTDTEMRAIFGL